MVKQLLHRVGARLGVILPGVFLLFFAVIGSVPAAGIFQLDDIYEAQVPVDEESQAVLDQAFRAAMVQVLVRVTGDADVSSAPGVSELVGEAGRYVQSYRFVKVAPAEQPAEQADTDAPPPPSADMAAQQPRSAVRVRFDDQALNTAIRARELPVWGRERPQTLIWLGVRTDGSDSIVNADDAADIASGLVSTALQRGVPVLFPLMDLQDQRQVAPADIWAGFYDRLADASQRYPHTDMLAISAVQLNGWQAEWTLLHDGTISAQWDTRGDSLDDLLVQGANRLADTYAQRFAVRQGAAGDRVRAVVDGVSSAADYARVDRFFSGITAASDVQVVAVDGDQATFSLSVSGDVDYLKRVIALGDVLEPGEPPAQTEAPQPGSALPVLYLRLRHDH